MSLDIRAATEQDVGALVELAATTFRATYLPFVDAATVEAVVEQACTEEAFRQLIARANGSGPDCLLVAVDDDDLVGFLDFGPEPEGAELRRLYTKVGGTSRGVGSSLLGHFESTLATGTRYRIVVLAANTRAVSFWQRHGFQVVGEIDGIEHFNAHRGVEFSPDTRPETLLVMDRVVGS